MRVKVARRPAGLTLVELLVSLSLLVMVAGAVVAVLSAGFRIWERVQMEGRTETTLHLTLEQIRKDLQRCRSFKAIPFRGEYDKVSFSALVPVIYRRDHSVWTVQEPGRIGYFFDSGRRFLGRSQHPYRVVRRYGVKENSHPVFNDADRVRFWYYSVDSDGSAHWLNSWDSEEVPLAVKIEVSTTDPASHQTRNQTTVVPIQIWKPTKR